MKVLGLIEKGNKEIEKLEIEKSKIEVISGRDLSIYIPEREDFKCEENFLNYCFLLGKIDTLKSFLVFMENYYIGEFYEEDIKLYPVSFIHGRIDSIFKMKEILS